MDWWVTTGEQKPRGPVTTELLLKGIEAGKVPREALVCEVGGTSWKSIRDVEVFASAFAERRSVVPFDPDTERTAFDLVPLPPSPSEPPPPIAVGAPITTLEDGIETTITEHEVEPHSEAPPEESYTFDDTEEKTIVDMRPPMPSEPPK